MQGSNLAGAVCELTMFGSREDSMQKHCVCSPVSLSHYGYS